MMKHLTAAFAATALIGATANAAVIDFANEADTNGERGEANFTVLNIDGVNVSVAAGEMLLDGFVLVHGELNPYLDESINGDPGGLGVCRELEDGPGSECADSSDDSIDGDLDPAEAINVFFPDEPLNIEGLSFWDGDHNSLADSDFLVNYAFFFADGTNTGLQTSTFAALTALAMAGIENVIAMNFGFNNREFYLASIDYSQVPIPGALPLLLSGIAGLGFASRRKKAKA